MSLRAFGQKTSVAKIRPASDRTIITSGSTRTVAQPWNASSNSRRRPMNSVRNLEQLRAIDAGMRIDVMIVESVPLGVDTPEDLEKARKLLGG